MDFFTGIMFFAFIIYVISLNLWLGMGLFALILWHTYKLGGFNSS